jgi:hypothetical protein
MPTGEPGVLSHALGSARLYEARICVLSVWLGVSTGDDLREFGTGSHHLHEPD